MNYKRIGTAGVLLLLSVGCAPSAQVTQLQADLKAARASVTSQVDQVQGKLDETRAELDLARFRIGELQGPEYHGKLGKLMNELSWAVGYEPEVEKHSDARAIEEAVALLNKEYLDGKLTGGRLDLQHIVQGLAAKIDELQAEIEKLKR